MPFPRALATALPAVLITVLLAFPFAVASAQDFVPVPALKMRVTDRIGMLTPAQRNTLENVLKEYESRSGSQIAILLIGSTAPESIEQYSIRVADEWKLGRKGVDDGVLLIVARDNPPALRRLRIEAFRGVQGSLTDVQAKRIIEDVIAPHFRQNDFYGGLTAAVSGIISLLEAEQLPAPAGQGAQQDEDNWPFLLFAIFIAFMILSARRNSRRYRHRHAWGRSVPGVILGGAIGHGIGTGWGGASGGGFGGGGFSGGGGGADGGGASGNW
jgi:uncharacterized protein